MNIWKISIQNIKAKPLYTLLSIFMLSLSITLLLGIQQLKTSFQYQIENNLGGVDLVIGAKGSPLQLVLSSVLHIESPTGNIAYKTAKKMGENPMIKMAVPISYGDNYKGYRIVGTTPEFATLYNAELEIGHFVQEPSEVVLGSAVAEKLQLKIGDTFQSAHGLIENTVDVHDEKLLVVGILKPTQNVIDRLILTNLETVWNVHDHEAYESEEHHEHDNEEQDEEKEITSLLISFRNPSALLTLPRRINENTNMQAALPKYELDRLYEYTGLGFKTISWIAYIILIISGITIFISLYKMIKDRAFDLALLRTYGASNFQLIKMVTYEALIIVCLAFIIGVLLTKIGLYTMFNLLEDGYQQNIIRDLPLNDYLHLVGLVVVLIILSIALAIYPIIKMNISTILSNEK